MKLFATLTIASILIALSFNAAAQEGKYVKLTRGQIVPFDTAVAVSIDQYRKETRKLQLADAVILRQDSLTRALISKSRACDSLIGATDLQLLMLRRRSGRLQGQWQEAESDLSQALDQVTVAERKLRSPFRKPWIYLALGAGVTLILSR